MKAIFLSILFVFAMFIANAQTLLSYDDMINIQKSNIDKVNGFFSQAGWMWDSSKKDDNSFSYDGYTLDYDKTIWKTNSNEYVYLFQKSGYANVLAYFTTNTHFNEIEEYVKTFYSKYKTNVGDNSIWTSYRGQNNLEIFFCTKKENNFYSQTWYEIEIYDFSDIVKREATLCSNCKGTGQIIEYKKCSYCNGTGKENCNDCNGKGKIYCRYCTEGYNKCNYCGGTGTVKCPKCWGQGKINCPKCYGQGSITCSKCYGTGKLQYCPTCNGTGKITKTALGGYLTSTYTCPDCNGTGRGNFICPNCAGKGKLTCSNCAGVGTLKCANCDGAGMLTCSNCSGTGNTSLGSYAGQSNNTGANNTFIGNSSDAGANNLTDATAVGDYAVASINDQAVLGNASNTWVGTMCASTWQTLSDGRFKFNIQQKVKGLEFINKLRPVTYQMNSQALDSFLIQNMSDSAKIRHKARLNFGPSTAIIHAGFIAQQVDSAAQTCGFTSSIVHRPANNTDPYTLAYAEIVVPLVKAVQELSHTIDSMAVHSRSTDSLLNVLQNCCTQGSLQKTYPNNSNDQDNSINIQNIELTNNAVLYQNSPNPFGSGTTIKYFVPDNANSQITFYDEFGNQIKIYKIEGNGMGQLNIDSSNLSTGMYSYSLIVNGKVIDTKKMVKQ